MVSAANPDEVKGRNYTVRQLLDDFDRDLGTHLKGQPDVEATVRTTMGKSYLDLGLYDKLLGVIIVHSAMVLPFVIIVTAGVFASVSRHSVSESA